MRTYLWNVTPFLFLVIFPDELRHVVTAHVTILLKNSLPSLKLNNIRGKVNKNQNKQTNKQWASQLW